MLCYIFQTDGEVQRGSEDVGEVKEEYVGEFSCDFGLLVRAHTAWIALDTQIM